ncbi:tsukushi [Conger conger]|uniref:tsukushi n=1 Tax=Conger conger TaxID=82655 RepID=UPI002A5ADCBD|nr:tsukushi [Conger conger]XP_061073763.1 tsukushi [Conger conger]
MATLLWMAVSLLLAAQLSGAVRTCHPGCRCEVESFGLFDSFSLTRVDCSGLGLGLGGAAQPVSIPLDTSHLDLSSNEISSLSRGLLSGPGYTTLASLDLSSNQLQTVEANAFSRLRYLEMLDLSHNALEGLAEGCFSGLPLTELDLSGNRLSALRLGALSAPALQSLTLAGNRLAAVPSLGGVGLRYLSLDSNPIAEIPEGAFAGLGELVHLSLTGLWDLTAIRPGAFRNLRSLQVLDLSDAPRLTQLEPEVFRGLGALQELILSRSGVVSLPQNMLTHLPSLRSLTLGTDIHCWKTHRQGQLHREHGQGKSDLVLTCNVAAVML